jgi:hypothetical protein
VLCGDALNVYDEMIWFPTSEHDVSPGNEETLAIEPVNAQNLRIYLVGHLAHRSRCLNHSLEALRRPIRCSCGNTAIVEAGSWRVPSIAHLLATADRI